MADFDIKAIISKITEKFKGDSSALTGFFKDPVKTIESVTGINLPDEKVKEVVDGIKAKISGGEIKLPDGLSLDKLGGMLGKKDDPASGIIGKIKNILG
ncbi:MAG: hypothetical protein K6D94_02065 [Clostridiales bacterium]|nr:hypothetical protein [Clostridiales bacterium]